MLDYLLADPEQRAIGALEQCFAETGDERYLRAIAQVRPPKKRGRLKGSGLIDDRPHLLRMALLLQQCPTRRVGSLATQIWREIGGQSKEAVVHRLQRKFREQRDTVLVEIAEQDAFKRAIEDLRAAEGNRWATVPAPDTPTAALASPSLTIRR